MGHFDDISILSLGPNRLTVLFSSKSGSRSLSILYKTVQGREVGIAIIQNGDAISKEIKFEAENRLSIVIQYIVHENGISYCKW